MRLSSTAALGCAAAAAALALAAPPALTKDGVRAIAEGTVRLDTAPGERMRVTFRLRDRTGQPFGAGGIYLRVDRCGRRPLTIPARELSLGRYTARLKVPRRMRKLTVGLEGWRTAGGKTERADAFFDFAPPLRRRC